MSSKIRVLQVVGAMDRAGTETWLLHLVRNIDRSRFQVDFVVHTDRACAYDEELKQLGCEVHLCSSPSNPVRYGLRFLQVLRHHGPYQVVHSHLHNFSGLVMLLAAQTGVPVRIAHSHSSTGSVGASTPVLRKLWLKALRRSILVFASDRLAASEPAAEALFGSSWKRDTRSRVLHCGLDFSSFETNVDRAAVRSELGLEVDDFVVGHVGRFCPEKNHRFLLLVFSEIAKLRAKAKLVLVGVGPLLEATRDQAVRLGIERKVRFLGARSDIAQIMRGVMDTFVMPSVSEGLGLAVVEAQAAGLPVTVSSGVPAEADAGCGLLQYLSLDLSPHCWALRILEQSTYRRVTQQEALRAISQSKFNLHRSAERLCKVYAQSDASDTVLTGYAL